MRPRGRLGAPPTKPHVPKIIDVLRTSPNFTTLKQRDRERRRDRPTIHLANTIPHFSSKSQLFAHLHALTKLQTPSPPCLLAKFNCWRSTSSFYSSSSQPEHVLTLFFVSLHLFPPKLPCGHYQRGFDASPVHHPSSPRTLPGRVSPCLRWARVTSLRSFLSATTNRFFYISSTSSWYFMRTASSPNGTGTNSGNRLKL